MQLCVLAEGMTKQGVYSVHISYWHITHLLNRAKENVVVKTNMELKSSILYDV